MIVDTFKSSDKSNNGPLNFFYVISHERSGTHFLINSIQMNTTAKLKYLSIGGWFGPYDQVKNRFDHIDKQFSLLEPGCSYIVKSHCDHDLFKFKYPQGKTVYICRDYRDVLVSYYHFLQDGHLLTAQQNNPEIPQIWFSNFSDFLKQPIPDFLRWHYSLYGNFSSPLERWLNHTLQWINAASKTVMIVTYNKLYSHTEETIQKTLDFLNLPCKQFFVRPSFENSYSVLPRKGIIGDWKNHFSIDDTAYLAPLVSAYHPYFDWSPWEV